MYHDAMATLAPHHEITFIEKRCEVHSKIGGFWNAETIHTYFNAVDEACLPLVKARKPIFALVDFSDFVPQDRATGDEIRSHLMRACKFGLKKVAIVGASPLVKMQYRRLSEGVTVEFFEDVIGGEAWLRS